MYLILLTMVDMLGRIKSDEKVRTFLSESVLVATDACRKMAEYVSNMNSDILFY